MISLSSNVSDGLNANASPAWVIRLILDSDVLLWSSIPFQEVDENVPVVGKYPLSGGLSEISQSIDISEGGNLAAVGNCSLAVNEFANASGTHTEYLPQVGGTELLNRVVQIGIAYPASGNVSLATDVVWLYSGVVSDYNSNRTTLSLDVIGVREVEQRIIPTIILDKGIYPDCPDENVGKPLPILYGNFSGQNNDTDIEYQMMMPAPLICIDQVQKIFVAAGHETSTAGYKHVWLYDSPTKTYVYIKTIDGSLTTAFPTINNNDAGRTTITFSGGFMFAEAYIRLANVVYTNLLTAAQAKLAIDYELDGTATYTEFILRYTEARYSFDTVPSGKLFDSSIIKNQACVRLFEPSGDAPSHYILSVIKADDGSVVASGSIDDASLVGNDYFLDIVSSVASDVSDLGKYIISIKKVGTGVRELKVEDIFILARWMITDGTFVVPSVARTSSVAAVNRRRSSGVTRGGGASR